MDRKVSVRKGIRRCKIKQGRGEGRKGSCHLFVLTVGSGVISKWPQYV